MYKMFLENRWTFWPTWSNTTDELSSISYWNAWYWCEWQHFAQGTSHPGNDSSKGCDVREGAFLLQGLMNNRLPALVHFIHTEAKGLRTVLDRRLAQRLEQGKAWFVVVWWSCKGHAVPAALAGAAQLVAYINSSCWNKAFELNHRSQLESSVASQVSTPTYPCILSGPSIGKTCSLSKK